MSDEERIAKLRRLQRQMQHVWNTIEMMTAGRHRVDSLWIKFEIMEIEEHKLLRTGRMIA